MIIHSTNDKYPHGKSSYRRKAETEDMVILKAGTESGIELETKYLDKTWTVTLSPNETKKLIQSLLKKS